MKPKQKVGVVIILITTVLVCIKGSIWFTTGSIAVQSEMFNSAVDLLYSLIIITGFLLSQREKSSKYPEGLIRLEPLVSMIVSGIIVVTGIAIAYNGIQQLFGGTSQTKSVGLAALALIISAVGKFVLYKYVSAEAEKHKSPSLAATSVDARNDVLTSIAALVGVVSLTVGLEWVEPLTAIIISGYITYSGVRVAEENISYALGKSADDEKINKIEKAAMKCSDVYGLHDVEIHHTGPLLDISLHAEIEGDIKIEEGHEIERSIADRVRASVDDEVNEINIHLDPKTLGEWRDENK